MQQSGGWMIRAIVVTTDFFTPVVDDAYDYGAIAATNSLSDIYAMGGTPFLALNVAALPSDLPTEISADILRGGAEKRVKLAWSSWADTQFRIKNRSMAWS